MKTLSSRWIILLLLLAFLIGGCGSKATLSRTTVEPSPTKASTSTATVVRPTSTHTPIPSPTSSPTPLPVSDKYIGFISDRDGQTDIYATNGDGSQLLRLTNDTAEESYLRFSPDGLRLAFLSDQDGEKAISVLMLGESTATRLTQGYQIRQFDWSPEGKSLVFAARKPNSGIYALPVEGGEPQELAGGTDYYYTPVWSPVGDRIAYLAGDEELRKIYVMNADGSEQELLTPTSLKDLYAVAWSPDGKQVAFSGKDEQSDIYLINLEDKNLVQLTDDAIEDEVTPGAWSPDGQWLLFWSSPQELGDIYRFNLQTKVREQLTIDPHDDFYPRWSVDGKQVAFSSLRDGNREVYLFDLQSKSEQNLTQHPASDFDLVWYPIEPATKLADLVNQSAAQALPTATLSPLPAQGSIISISNSGDKNEFYMISPEGGDPTQLTDNALIEIAMDWSPDCSQGVVSAFPEDSVFDEDSNLFLIRRDGLDLRQVTYMTFTALVPQWSPDGSKILFLSDDPGVTDLYILDLQSNQVKKLTPDPLGGDIHGVPWQSKMADWSPDGKWIVYAGPGETNWDLYKISADGKESSLLSQDPAAEGSPTFSPDGSRVAFVRYLPAGCSEDCNVEIFVMNSDGSQVKQLVQNPKADFSPIWSPDGQKLLFLSNRDGNVEIYIVNADGKGIKNLTRNKADDYSPYWSPDGSQIVFTSQRDGDPEIYRMNSDGTEVTRLTNNPGNDYSNAWICQGSQ